MRLQKVFRRSYAEYLRTHINVEYYRQEKFPYDEKKTVELAGVYRPDGLPDEMDPGNDFKSAVALYEAYSGLSPLLASMPDLWVYLAHADLFPYMQERRREVFEDNCTQDYIVHHWFRHNVSVMRMTLPGFWWAVHLTRDEERDNPYELTEVLFRNQELRTTSFGPLPLIRHREAMIGILEFIKEHGELLQDGFNMRARYIQKLFNGIGGYTLLPYMDRHFFKGELEKRLGTISRRLTRQEIQESESLFKDIKKL